MLASLDAKQALARGVLDDQDVPDEMASPDAAKAREDYLKRLENVIQMRLPVDQIKSQIDESKQPETTPVLSRSAHLSDADQLRQALQLSLSAQLKLIQRLPGKGGLVVYDAADIATTQTVMAAIQQIPGLEPPDQWLIMDRQHYELLQRATRIGFVSETEQMPQDIFRAEGFGQAQKPDLCRLQQTQPLVDAASHAYKVAECLLQGAFFQEAVTPLCQAVQNLGIALAVLASPELMARPPARFTRSWLPLIRDKGLLSAEQLQFLGEFDANPRLGKTAVQILQTRTEDLLKTTREHLVRLTL